MIRLIRTILSAVRRRRGQTEFNSGLLEQHRNDAFAAMHQQLGGLR